MNPDKQAKTAGEDIEAQEAEGRKQAESTKLAQLAAKSDTGTVKEQTAAAKANIEQLEKQAAAKEQDAVDEEVRKANAANMHQAMVAARLSSNIYLKAKKNMAAAEKGEKKAAMQAAKGVDPAKKIAADEMATEKTEAKKAVAKAKKKISNEVAAAKDVAVSLAGPKTAKLEAEVGEAADAVPDLASQAIQDLANNAIRDAKLQMRAARRAKSMELNAVNDYHKDELLKESGLAHKSFKDIGLQMLNSWKAQNEKGEHAHKTAEPYWKSAGAFAVAQNAKDRAESLLKQITKHKEPLLKESKDDSGADALLGASMNQLSTDKDPEKKREATENIEKSVYAKLMSKRSLVLKQSSKADKADSIKRKTNEKNAKKRAQKIEMLKLRGKEQFNKINLHNAEKQVLRIRNKLGKNVKMLKNAKELDWEARADLLRAHSTEGPDIKKKKDLASTMKYEKFTLGKLWNDIAVARSKLKVENAKKEEAEQHQKDEVKILKLDAKNVKHLSVRMQKSVLDQMDVSIGNAEDEMVNGDLKEAGLKIGAQLTLLPNLAKPTRHGLGVSGDEFASTLVAVEKAKTNLKLANQRIKTGKKILKERKWKVMAQRGVEKTTYRRFKSTTSELKSVQSQLINATHMKKVAQQDLQASNTALSGTKRLLKKSVDALAANVMVNYICGDGIVGGLEQCDDGNMVNGDGCSDTCVVELGWKCKGKVNEAHAIALKMAMTECKSSCGDGFKVGTEECDDGNQIYGDGCDSNCRVEKSQGWRCHGGSLLVKTRCEKCGDGHRGDTETCDDGNNKNGDGCSDTCQIEQDYTCMRSGGVDKCLPENMQVAIFDAGRRSKEAECKQEGQFAVMTSMEPVKGACTVNPLNFETQARTAVYKEMDGDELYPTNVMFTKLGSVASDVMFSLRSDSSPDPARAMALCHVYKRQVCSLQSVVPKAEETKPDKLGETKMSKAMERVVKEKTLPKPEQIYKCKVQADTKCLEVAVQASYCKSNSSGKLVSRTYYPDGKACIFENCDVPKDWITIHNLRPRDKNAFCYAAAMSEFD